MRYRVRDLAALQISLQRENIVPDNDDVVALLFANAPDQNVNLARVLRKISCDLLADESVGKVANLQATVDRVVIGDCNKIHSAFEQFSMQLARVGIGVRKIKPPEKPFLRSRAEAGVNVEVTFAHIYLEAALEPLLPDPILVGRRRSTRSHFTDKIDNLPPNGRMRKIRGMNTEAHKRLFF